jgi:hypothetical protein
MNIQKQYDLSDEFEINMTRTMSSSSIDHSAAYLDATIRKIGGDSEQITF